MVRSALLVVVVLAAGCGTGSGSHPTAVPTSPAPPTATSSPAVGARQTAVPAEQNPPGDIPDNLAFVVYRSASGHYRFSHPEGWAQAGQGSTVTFTDKLNGVRLQPGPDTTAPTVDSARHREVPQLSSSELAFQLQGVSAVTVPAGRGVRIVYRRNSAPDPVTGRQYRDEVQRYEIVASGREVIVELYGPVGADNVDAYRTMISSLRFL